MQSNIDARGRLVRRNSGIACLTLGAGVAVAALLSAYPRTLGSISAFLILSGLFQLFESRNGWCAIRAMGFKTPV